MPKAVRTGIKLSRCPLRVISGHAINPRDVRFTPNSGHCRAQLECLLWAMYGRRPRCKRNLTFCEAFGCSHVSGLFSNGGVTSIAMQPLWLLALM